MISLRGINVSLNQQPILSGVSFDSIPEGVVAIMGPSGCGKSTLLKALMGVYEFSGGEIEFDSSVAPLQSWHAGQRIFTLVPQVPLLLPWKTLEDNISLAAPRREPRDSAKSRAAELLSVVGLSDAAKKYPWEVSQGMAARASLARTLMLESRVLLLDEPFAAIDATTRFRLQHWLLQMIGKLKIQAVIVTHDPREALLIADEVIVLGGRPAEVRKRIAPPPRALRVDPDWIFGPEAGALERELRLALAEGIAAPLS